MSHESFPTPLEEEPTGIRKEGLPPDYVLLGSMEFDEPLDRYKFHETVERALKFCTSVSTLELVPVPLSEDEVYKLKLCMHEVLSNDVRTDKRRLLALRVGFIAEDQTPGASRRLLIGISDNEPGFSVDDGREQVGGILEEDEEDIENISESGRGIAILESWTYAQYHSPYTNHDAAVIGKTVWFEYNLTQPPLPFDRPGTSTAPEPYL